MTTPTPSYYTLPTAMSCPLLPNNSQEISTYPVVPTVYFVNDVPYCCYPEQPNILYPVYPVYIPMQQGQPEHKERVLGDIVSAVGDVIETKVNSLENYVNNMEQQTVNATQEKIKTSCLAWCS